jgi:two-component system response regulator NreC
MTQVLETLAALAKGAQTLEEPAPETPIRAMAKMKVFIADDHALVREGIRLLLAAQPDMEVVGEAGDGEGAAREVRRLQPDVVLMDVSMPILGGAAATERIMASCPQTYVLALSAYNDPAHIRQLLNSGARGYVLKKAIAEELAGAIRAVARGGMHIDPTIADGIVQAYLNPELVTEEDSLSAREQEVLVHIAWGHSNREIADKLHLSVKTVEGYKARLMEKLGLRSRSDIVRYALRRGWLQED